MFGESGGLGDASRAYQTYCNVDALDKKVRAGVADATNAVQRTSDALVAHVNDAMVSSENEKKSDPPVGPVSATPVGTPSILPPERRKKKHKKSVRAWTVVSFHMGGESYSNSTGGDCSEQSGILVKPKGRRAVFLYVPNHTTGTQDLVAQTVLPTGVDAPEPGETMAVGPRAVRVVGEIENFVTEEDLDADCESTEDEDESMGKQSDDTAGQSETSSWWSWGAQPALGSNCGKTKSKSEETSAQPVESETSWFGGLWGAGGSVAAKPNTAKETDTTNDKGVPSDPPSPPVPSKRSVPVRAVFIPTPPPPPSIVSDVKLWAPRVASVDTNQTSSECSVTAQTSPYVPYVPPANSGIPGSMESMGGSGAVGFSYAFAAEASFGKVTRGDVCETVAPSLAEPETIVTEDEAKHGTAIGDSVGGAETMEANQAAQETETDIETESVVPLENSASPPEKPVTQNSLADRIARLTASEIAEMEHIRFRIQELVCLLHASG